MRFLIAYDAWCIGRVEALLLWLEEWLSISQKQVERGLIVLYMLLIMVPSSWALGIVIVRIFVAISVGMMMWWLHRQPAAYREMGKRNALMAVARVIIQAFLGFLAAILFILPPHRLIDYATGAAQVVYLVFYYMTDIHSGGERGRRRKLAWAELKKLFGTEWIPRPAPGPAAS